MHPNLCNENEQEEKDSEESADRLESRMECGGKENALLWKESSVIVGIFESNFKLCCQNKAILQVPYQREREKSLDFFPNLSWTKYVEASTMK